MVTTMFISAGTLEFVSAVAAVNERLVDWARQLRNRSDVLEVTRGMDVRNYESGTTMELFVEANFKDERPITWWIDVILRPQSWAIEGSVRLLRNGAQITLKEYTGRIAVNSDELTAHLCDLVSQLLQDAPDVLARTRND
jgi:hypothetical protein